MSSSEAEGQTPSPWAHDWPHRRIRFPPRHGYAGVRLDQMPVPLLHRTRLRQRGPVTLSVPT